MGMVEAAGCLRVGWNDAGSSRLLGAHCVGPPRGCKVHTQLEVVLNGFCG